MKRILFCMMLIALIGEGLVFSSAPDHLTMGLGNDLMSYGITRNDDDQLSFSTYLHADFGDLQLDLDFLSITNRGWKHGWDPRDNSKPYMENVIERGRYDQIDLSAAYDLHKEFGSLELALTPRAGLSLIGDLGLEFFQQSVHRVFGIHGVDLPYDTDKVRPYALLDLKAKASYGITDNLKLITTLSGSTVPGFDASTNLAAGLAVSASGKPFLDMGLAYNKYWAHTSWYTQKLYAEYLEGLQFFFNVDADLYRLTYTGNLQSNFGVGAISVDVMKLINGLEHREKDMFVNLGFCAIYDEHRFRVLEFEVPVADKLSVFLSNAYIAGDALTAEAEKNADLFTEKRYKLNHLIMQIGARYRFNQLFGLPLQPYAGLSAGVYVANYDVLQNMLADPSIQVPSYKPNRAVFMAVDLEAGISIPLPKELPVSLYLAGGLMFNVGLKPYPNKLIHPTDYVSPHATLGFSTAIDL